MVICRRRGRGYSVKFPSHGLLDVTAVASTLSLASRIFIVADLRSRCGHYIFVLWVLLSSFFLGLSQPSQTGLIE